MSTHPYCSAWKSLLALSVAYWLWLQRSQGGQKVLGWASIPPCCFSSCLIGRSTTDDASLKLKFRCFFSCLALSWAFSILPYVCVPVCPRARCRVSEMQSCLFVTIPAFQHSLSHNVAAFSQHTVTAHTGLHTVQTAKHKHPHSCTTYTLTQSHTRPAYWSVTIETERLPNRGYDGDGRGEEEVYLSLFFQAKHELMNQSVSQLKLISERAYKHSFIHLLPS